GDGGHHDHGVLAEETLLVARARVAVQACVVRQCLDTGFDEAGSGLVHLAAAEAIDDAGFTAMRVEEIQQLPACVLPRGDAIADVGPVETGNETARGVKAQPLDDLLARAV